MEEIEAEELALQRKQKNRSAALVSVVAHIVFGLIAWQIVALHVKNKPQATFYGDPPPRPRLKPDQLKLEVRKHDLEKRSAPPRLQPRLLAMSPSELALPEIKADPKAIDKKVRRSVATLGMSGMGSGMGGGFGFGAGGGRGGTPKILRDRCSVDARSINIKRYGGDEKSEVAVIKGLRYLKSIQNGDGSYGHLNKGAMTGIVLLAFLGHCETPASVEFGVCVRGMMNFLVETGSRQHGHLHVNGQGHGPAYAHGIATYAMAEAYSMTKDASILSTVQRAIGIIEAGQTSMGGWVYGYKPGGCDMSVTSWQIQALKASRISGAKNTSQSLIKAAAMLAKHQKSDGAWSYRLTDDNGKGLTGSAALCVQIAGGVAPGGEYFERKSSSSYGPSAKGVQYLLRQSWGNPHVYYWYYNTLACFNQGGPSWQKWQGIFLNRIVQSQQANGSWPSFGGSLQQGGGAGRDGDAWRNAICCLMLEVYYRYLPSS